jgi:hypothetical protein
MRSEQSSGGLSDREQSERQMRIDDLRSRFKWLESFSDVELREISLCSEDEELEPGQEYFDVSHPERGVITANKGDRSPAGSCYVSRSSVSSQLWKKLVSFGERQARP